MSVGEPDESEVNGGDGADDHDSDGDEASGYGFSVDEIVKGQMSDDVQGWGCVCPFRFKLYLDDGLMQCM